MEHSIPIKNKPVLAIKNDRTKDKNKPIKKQLVEKAIGDLKKKNLSEERKK